MPFGVHRSYFSHAAYATWPSYVQWPMGKGWFSTFNMRIYAHPTEPGVYTLVQPAGGQTRFVERPNGSFAVRSNEDAPLVAARQAATPPALGAITAFTLNLSGIVYDFDASGILTKITDRNGYVYAYDLPPASGTGPQVVHDYSTQWPTTDPAAPHRKLTATWENGKIEKIESSLLVPGTSTSEAGPMVDYVYSSDDLTEVKVSDPSNDFGDTGEYRWQYTYSAHVIMTMRDPKAVAAGDTNHDVVNVYGSAQEGNPVKAQRDRDGSWTYFDYEPQSEIPASQLPDEMRSSIGLGSNDPLYVKAVVITTGVTGALTDPDLSSGLQMIDGRTRRVDVYGSGNSGHLRGKRVQVMLGDQTSYPNFYEEVRLFDYDPATGGLRRVWAQNPANFGEPARKLAEYSYDSEGRPLTSTVVVNDTTSRTTTYGGYNAFDQPGTITDNAGTQTRLTYDGGGNPLTVCTPTGAGTSACSEPPSASDQLTQHLYTTVPPDARPGLVAGRIDPRGKIWSYTTDPTYGLLKAVADPLGNVSHTKADAVGRTLWTIPPKGAGGPLNETNPYAVKFETNAFGDPTKVTDALGNTVTKLFDRNRQLTSSTEPAVQEGGTRSTEMIYDYSGRAITVKAANLGAPNEIVQDTQYYPSGLLKAQVQDGQSTVYGYDAAGRPVTVQQPLGDCGSNRVLCDEYVYNDLGHMVEHRQSKSTAGGTPPSIGYTYERNGQVKKATYSQSGQYHVSDVQYDNLGRRTRLDRRYDNPTTGTLSTSTWSWDRLSRLTSQTDENNDIVGYTWDLNSNLAKIAYPAGNCGANPVKCVTRTYDDASRWTSVTDWNNKTVSFDPDANGNYTSYTFPTTTPTKDTYGFDQADRMTNVDFRRGTGQTPAAYGSLAYNRYGAGELASEAATGIAGATSESYGYDKAGRLCFTRSGTTSTSDSCTSAEPALEKFETDKADNLTRLPGGPKQIFNPLNQLCYTSNDSNTPGVTGNDCTFPSNGPTDATKYSYDPRGNRTAKTPPASGDLPSTYTWNQNNELTSAVVPMREGNDGDYTPLASPTRIFDTQTLSPPTPVAAGGAIEVTVMGAGTGIPDQDVGAVALMVATHNQTSTGNLTVYSSDLATMPNTSNLNWQAGEAIGNTVVVKPGC